jgi:hypothetical protein
MQNLELGKEYPPAGEQEAIKRLRDITERAMVAKSHPHHPTKVATISIPAQDVNTPGRLVLNEQQSFSPWHSLAAHQSLGGRC